MMNQLKSILLFTLLLLGSGILNAQTCQAIWTNESGTVSGEKLFIDNSINSTSITLLTPGASPASSTFLPGETASVVFPSSGYHPFTYIVSNSVTSCSDTVVSSIQVCLITPPSVSVGSNPGEFTVTDAALDVPGESGSIQFNLANFLGSTISGNTNISSVSNSTVLTTDSNGPHNFWYHTNNALTGCYDSILVSFDISTVSSCQAVLSTFNLWWISDGVFQLNDQSSNMTTGTFYCAGSTPSTINFNSWSGYLSDTVSFAANGAYPYTYVTYDSISNCSDTVTGVINVTAYPPPCAVQAGSTISQLNPNPQYYYFYDNSTNPTGGWSGSLSFTPDPGIGSTPSTISNSGSYAMVFNSNGVYYYTYTVTDSVCSSTISDSVVVFSYPSGSPCQADIEWTMGPGPGQVTLLDTSTNFTTGTFYCVDAIPQSATVLPGVATIIEFGVNATFQYSYTTQDSTTTCNDSILGIIGVSGVPCPPMSPVLWSTTSNPGEIIFEDPTFTGNGYAYVSFLSPSNTLIYPSYPITMGNTVTANVTGNGTYYFSYKVINSQINCSDSIIDSLVISSFTACQAGLTYNEYSPGNIHFIDQSTNVQQGELYCTGLTPQTYSISINQASTNNGGLGSFAANGSYPYTYIVHNTTTGCSDTLTGVFVVSGLPTPCAVQADLIITPGVGLGDYVIADNSTGGGSVSSFDPGNGQSPIALLPSALITVNYTANGVYWFEYLVTDTTGNCSDTLFGTIVVSGYPLPCNTQAILGITQGANPGEYTITDNSLNAFGGTYYSTNVSGAVTFVQGGSNLIEYASNGLHYYTYVVQDSTGMCSDTIYGSINVSGVNCGAFAGVIVNPTGVAGEFTVTDNSLSGTSSIFTPGNFVTPLQVLPSSSGIFTYTSNGTYTYSYVVFDSTTLCQDSISGTLVVTGIIPPANCSASFTLTQDTTNASQYYCWNTALNSLGGTSGLDYLWDFGDGNTSTLAYPTHTYGAIGNFVLCLTITDSLNGCTSTYCDTVVVTVKASGTTINVLPAGATIGLNEETLFSGIKLFPNPSNGIFNILLDSKENALIEFEIISSTGQVLFVSQETLSVGSNEIKVNKPDLSKGLYLIKLKSVESGKIETIRFMKE